MPLDVIDLAQQLIRCPSITPDSEQPEDTAVFDVLERVLEPLGFVCHRLRFEEEGYAPVTNFFARLGEGRPHMCFAGHTDVVPVGDEAAWTHPPFAATIVDDVMYGRGTEDMKGAIAAFIGAVSRFLASQSAAFAGSLSFCISGDEEGVAINGTPKMLEWMRDNNQLPDMCVVGEPTNPQAIGDMVKIGRRGSAGFALTIKGKQGHVAYPDLAANPVTVMAHILSALKNKQLDEGTEFFPPSNLEITTVDVGNPAVNVIPAEATSRFNIRFNTHQTGEELEQWVRGLCERVSKEGGCQYDLAVRVSAQPFITEPGALSSLMEHAVKAVTGKAPALTTTGGTSDARFIKDICPVVEFGTTGKTAHMVDECVRVDDLHTLSAIYEEALKALY